MAESVRQSLDRADANTLADIMRYAKLGHVMSGFRRTIRSQNAVTGDQIVLPNLLKAKRVLSAYARAGTGTAGELTVVTTGSPTAGQVSWNAVGDIVFAAADDWTDVDVEYEPVMGVELVTLTGFPVVTNALTLPASALPADQLCSVVGYTAAGAASTKTVLAAGSTPSAGQANLNDAKATIVFNAADAVVTADVVMLKGIDPELGAALEADSTFV
jgi:hypothetical protein